MGITEHDVERARQRELEDEELIEDMQEQWLAENPDEQLKPVWWNEEYAPALQNFYHLQRHAVEFQHRHGDKLKFPLVELRYNTPTSTPVLKGWPGNRELFRRMMMNMCAEVNFVVVWQNAYERMQTIDEPDNAALCVLVDTAMRQMHYLVTGTDIDALESETYR